MMVTYLTREELIYINERTTAAHGGNFVPPDNLFNEDALNSLVDSVAAEMFGEELYPTIADKAALYMFNIIKYHAFQDGNKRTGLQSARTFVKLNDWNFREPLIAVNSEGMRVPSIGTESKSILLNLTLELASSRYSLEQMKAWFVANIQPVSKK
ncbi:MAG: type II toxin-antitoxin system death-on-curing family toxin [Bacteroidota bacterium]